jgi:hypothetical protein
MSNATKNKIRKVNYCSVGLNDNVTDFHITIIKPTGNVFHPNPTIQNLGDGLYSFSYTPNMDGLWIEKIKSNSNGDNTSQSIYIENYDLDDIRDQINKIRGGRFQN